MSSIDTFDFIDKPLLRENIDSIQNDVVNFGALLMLSKEKATRNCIRKTIVIYTASIIEALLLWKLNKEISSGNIDLKNESVELKDIGVSIPLRFEDGYAIAIARKIKGVKKIEKIDFKKRIDMCERKKIIGKDLVEKLHKTRALRNKLHIDGSTKVRKNYSQKDLDFVFIVQEEVMQAIT